MNTSLDTYEEVHAAYEAMILSDGDTKVDPVLMVGYEDKLEENSKALKALVEAEKKKDERANFKLDMKTYAIFFGSCAGTVLFGYKVMAIYDWLAAMI